MSLNTEIEGIVLRKAFSIENPVKKATLYACGLGQAVYHMNGKRATAEVYVTHYTIITTSKLAVCTAPRRGYYRLNPFKGH